MDLNSKSFTDVCFAKIGEHFGALSARLKINLYLQYIIPTKKVKGRIFVQQCVHLGNRVTVLPPKQQ